MKRMVCNCSVTCPDTVAPLAGELIVAMSWALAVTAPAPASTTKRTTARKITGHKHPKVKAWLEDHPRFHLHFTPTSASWLNLVERWFGIISQQAIRRSSFTSVAQLERAITRFLSHWNQDAKPFVWTKTARQIKGSIQNAKLISVR